MVDLLTSTIFPSIFTASPIWNFCSSISHLVQPLFILIDFDIVRSMPQRSTNQQINTVDISQRRLWLTIDPRAVDRRMLTIEGDWQRWEMLCCKRTEAWFDDGLHTRGWLLIDCET